MTSFKVVPFGIRVYVSVNPDMAEAQREADKKIKELIFHAEGAEAFCVFSFPDMFIWLGPHTTRNTILHEAWHGFQSILEGIGASGEDEEINAWIFAYFCDNLLKAYERQTKQPTPCYEQISAPSDTSELAERA